MSESSEYTQSKIHEIAIGRQIDAGEIAATAESLGATHILRKQAGVSVRSGMGNYKDETLLEDVLVADLQKKIKRGGRFTSQAVRLLQEASFFDRNRRSEHTLDRGEEIGVNTGDLLIKLKKKKVVEANGEVHQNGASTPPTDEIDNPF